MKSLARVQYANASFAGHSENQPQGAVLCTVPALVTTRFATSDEGHFARGERPARPPGLSRR